MQKLECSHVDYRRRFGDIIPELPSRFLQAIPDDLYTFRDRSNYFGTLPSIEKRRPERKPAAFTQAGAVEAAYEPDTFSQDTVEFRMGQQVVHKLYGRGRIVQISGFGEDMKISVVFNDGNPEEAHGQVCQF